MKCIHIITPVKDSIELTLQTVEAIVASDFQTPFTYTVYNDFSTEENTAKLQDASEKLGFELVNLAEITDHPHRTICWYCKWHSNVPSRRRQV